jgi:LysM repeat protein
MRPDPIVVLTAALLLTVAACAGATNGPSSSLQASPSVGPTPSTAVVTLPPTPRPSTIEATTTAVSSGAASGAAAPSGPQRTPAGTIYVIKSGDTLNRTAMRFKVSLKAILAANPNITNPNQILIGQKIVIPKP